MPGPRERRDDSYDFGTHPRQRAELERLRRQALAVWPQERRWLERLGLADGMRVLDAGCGPGFVTARLAEMNPGGQTVGLEPDAALGRLAAAAFAGCAGLSLHRGSLTDNDLPAGSFDFAYARFVLQHLAEPGEGLRGLLRLLAPGGRAVVVDADDGLTAIHPEPAELAAIMRALEERQQRAGGDRRVGRKLPHLMVAAGFAEVGFHVVPLTTHQLGHEALLELAVTSRLSRVPQARAAPLAARARRMAAFFAQNDWHGVVCVVAAFGSRPVVR
jgi:SAM-dependent methyltransferase